MKLLLRLLVSLVLITAAPASVFGVTLSVTQTNPTCQQCNGSFIALGANGPIPYQYSINGGATWFLSGTFTGKCAGTYTVIVKDAANNQVSLVVTLVNPPPLVFTASGTNCTTPTSCDGAISLSITGGVPPYTVTITGPSGNIPFTTSPVTGLCVGTYTITVTDSTVCAGHSGGPAGPSSAIISIGSGGGSTSPLTVSAGGNFGNCSQLCNYLTAVAAGGIPPYQYNFGNGWGSSATSSCLTGTGFTVNYTVCVKDAVGSTVCVVVPTGWPLYSWYINPIVTAAYCGSCSGSITIPYTFPGTVYGINPGNPLGQTSPQFTNLCPGTYTVSVVPPNNSGRCPQMATVVVPNQSAVLGVTSTVTNATCYSQCDGAVTINVQGTGPFEYSINGGVTWQPSNVFSSLCAGTYTVQVRNTSQTCSGTTTFTVTQLPAIAPSISATSPTCYGSCNGTVNIFISPASSYQYSINGGVTYVASSVFTGLCAGSYTVAVRQPYTGCSVTIPVTINQPPQIVAATQTSGSPTCPSAPNGSISIAASGGTGVLAYNWLPGNPSGDGTPSVYNLVSGTYSCVVTDANNCAITYTNSLTAPALPTVSTNAISNVTCYGGSNGGASVNVTGGSTPYTYNWTPGNPAGDGTPTVSGLSAGTWTCTVTAGSAFCVVTQTVSITQPPPVVATVSSNTSTTCYGDQNGSATITASGGAGAYSYAWSPYGGTSDTASGLGSGTYMCTITDVNGCTGIQSVVITEPSQLLSVPASVSSVSCSGGNNGTAAVSVSGGTAGYTYDWLPGNPSGDSTSSITGLIAGTYTCNVTDLHGCTATTVLTVTEPSVIVSAVAAQIDPFCQGDSTGSATLNVSGGTAPYQYSWSPAGGNTATGVNLYAGNFTCAISDSLGCTDTISLSVAEPTAVHLIVESVSGADCFGSATGDANVVAFGGAGYPFTYNWQPIGGNSQATIGLPAGTYTCIAFDSLGCSDTAVVTITQPAAVVAAITTNSTSCGLCNGDALASAVGGGGIYSFYWQGAPDSSFVDSLCSGTFELIVSDSAGCSDTLQFTIGSSIVAQIDSISVTGASSAQNNGTATVFANGNGPVSYLWDASSGNQTTQTAINLGPGNYCVVITDSTGCTDSSCVSVPVITSISEQAASILQVYPNPFSSTLSLKGNGKWNIVLEDIAGKRVVDFGSVTLNGSGWLTVPSEIGAGIYILKATNSSSTQIIRVIKE